MYDSLFADVQMAGCSGCWETDRVRERKRDIQRERETEIERDRETERKRQNDTWKHTKIEIETERNDRMTHGNTQR